MKVNVKLFAAARQYCGRLEAEIEIAEGATVGELRSALMAAYPPLETLLPSSMIALNHDYATDDHPIPEEAEIALIPPVSGG